MIRPPELDRLLTCNIAYAMAKRVRPYDGDLVQAWGLAFAYNYRRCEEFIRYMIELTDEEWDNYANHHWIMTGLLMELNAR